MGRHTPPDRQRKLVAQWRGSNLSAAAFARAHRVRPGTFLTWIARHPPEVSDPPVRVAFVEVTPAPELFTIRVGEHALAFEGPPPAPWLADLVRELDAC